jgi:hypothetical protein
MKNINKLNYCKINSNVRERYDWKKRAKNKALTEKSLLEYVLLYLCVICMIPDFCGKELGKIVYKISVEFFNRHSMVCKWKEEINWNEERKKEKGKLEMCLLK